MNGNVVTLDFIWKPGIDWNVWSMQSTGDPEVMNGMSEPTQKERRVGRRVLANGFFRLAVCGLQKWRHRDRGPVPDRSCRCSHSVRC